MLITEKLKIKNNGKITNYYLNLGYNLVDGYFTVNVKDLPPTSRYPVDCECDYCGKRSIVPYFKYKKSINNILNKYCCCVDCHHKRTREINQILFNCEHNFSKNHPSRKKWEDKMWEEEGISNVFQRSDVKEKIKETTRNKYNYDFCTQVPTIKEKMKKTFIDRYNVIKPLQDINFFHKAFVSSRKIKKFKNTELTYQGTYELDFLEKYYEKVKITKGISIRFDFDNKLKVYHSDFYLPDFNLIVEIKSTYTYNFKEELNLSKKENCLKQNFNFLFVMDKNYSELDEIISKKS